MTENRTYGRRRSLPAATEAPTQEVAQRGPAAPAPAQTSTSGWDAADRAAAGASSDIFFKVPETRTVVKIIDADPFDSYTCHWVDEIEEGSKSVRCMGEGCPLCGIGDKAKKVGVCFNVVSLEDPQAPVLRVWETGVKIAKQLKEIALDAKRGPLDRSDLYFTIRKIKKDGAKNIEYSLERIRARDLEEETGLRPLTEPVLQAFARDRYTEPVKEPMDMDDLKKLVRTLLGDD